MTGLRCTNKPSWGGGHSAFFNLLRVLSIVPFLLRVLFVLNNESAQLGVSHLVRTHEGGGESSKNVRHAYKKGRGGNLTHLSTRAKCPFCTYSVIFSYFKIICCLWRRISLLFIKTLTTIIFLSLEIFTVYFSIELLIGPIKTFRLEVRWGEGVTQVRVRTQWGSQHAHMYVRWGGQIWLEMQS